MLRIKELRNKNNMTLDELALKSGVSKRMISAYEGNENDITLSKLRNIAIALNVNIFDLVEYSGTKSENHVSDSGEPHSIRNQKTMKANGIPLIPIEAIAGFILGVDNGGVIQKECDHYVVPEFERLGAEFLIRVSGSSMYPKYSNGDVLACRKIKDVVFFQWGKVYVLDTSQGALVKRLYEGINNKEVICSSDNKENYPSFSIPKSDIRSLSIVLGVIRIE